MEHPDLKGKTAIITGASKGIGRHLAQQFAKAGTRVVVNYNHNRDTAEDLVDEINRTGGEAITVGADVSDKGAVQQMLGDTLEAFGTVDILVNNAGMNIDKPFLELDEQEWTRVLDVNLKGPFLCSQACGRVMSAAGSGKILNISAVTGIQARANAANYCSSKAGLNMLTKCTALELAPAVQVNAIAVGFFESDLVREVFSQTQLDAVCEGTPLGRMGTFDELAQLALFLTSTGSSFMTGQTIVLDGGRVMC